MFGNVFTERQRGVWVQIRCVLSSILYNVNYLGGKSEYFQRTSAGCLGDFSTHNPPDVTSFTCGKSIFYNMILPGIRQGSGEMGSRRCYFLGPDVSTEQDSSRAVPQNVESRLNTYIVQHTCAPTNIMQHQFGHDLVYFLASRRHSLARKPLRKTPDPPLCLSQTSSMKLGCCRCRFRGNGLVTY